MAALYHVVKNLQSANRATRLQHTSLALGALVTYQINALIYRPAEGDVELALLEASCQHVPNDTDGLSTRPIMYGRGAFFMSDIINDAGAYQLPKARLVDTRVLLKLYKRYFMEDIEVEFEEPQIPNKPKHAHTTRPPKKRKTTHTFNDHDTSDSDADDRVEGSIEEPEKRRSKGSTTPDTFRDLDSSITSELSAIKRQFASDIFQLAPAPKAALKQPWILLDSTQRERVKIDIFQSLNVGQVFGQAQYRVMSDTEWSDSIFGRYFPAKGASTANALQHFPFASYYRKWLALMKRLNEEDAEIFRKLVLTWFSKLNWLPHPESDRMWSTRKGGRGWSMLPSGDPQNCPRLAVNPRFHGNNMTLLLGVENCEADGNMVGSSQNNCPSH
jgi:hypothetical protein